MPGPDEPELWPYRELCRRAAEVLDPAVYDYIAGGSGTEETLAANERAWRHRWLRPRICRDVSRVETSTNLLGTPFDGPVGVAPVGFGRLSHPDGEVASAKGAAAAGAAGSGALFVLSTRSTATFEEVATVVGPWWFQVYLLRDRGLTADLVRQAVAGGARALVLTADTPYVGSKARGDDALARVRPGLVPDDLSGPGLFQAPDVTFDDIGWLREVGGGTPVVVKGVLRGDDAISAVDAGASAVWVSNHGGRQLDGAVPTAEALPEVVDAAGDSVEVYVDGGIRSGRDVLRAVAMGASGVFLGRPVAWALATGGASGVTALLNRVHDELVEALALAGCASLDDVTGDLLTPPVRW